MDILDSERDEGDQRRQNTLELGSFFTKGTQINSFAIGDC